MKLMMVVYGKIQSYHLIEFWMQLLMQVGILPSLRENISNTQVQ